MEDQGVERITLRKQNERVFSKSDLGEGRGLAYVNTAMYTQIIHYSTLMHFDALGHLAAL